MASAYVAVGDFLGTELTAVFCKEFRDEDYALLKEKVKTKEQAMVLVGGGDLESVRPAEGKGGADPYARIPNGQPPRTAAGIDGIVAKLKGTGIRRLLILMTACHDEPGWTSWDPESYGKSWIAPAP